MKDATIMLRVTTDEKLVIKRMARKQQIGIPLSADEEAAERNLRKEIEG